MSTQSLPAAHEWASADFLDDPYPFYARLRASTGPCWLPHRQETSSGGLWLFSRYQEAQQIFTSTQGTTMEISAIRSPGTGTPFDRIMLHRDNEDHLRLRKLVAGYFSAAAVDRLKPRIVAVAQELLASLQDQQEFDFVAAFADPLPLRVIAALVGVPEADMARVRVWSQAISAGIDSRISDPQVRTAQKLAMQEFFAYIDGLVEASRARPDDSLLGYLVQSPGERLDHGELAGMLAFLLFAGNVTTISLISNAVWLLLSNPAQWQLLQAQPELVNGAIEETLRFESPQQRTSFRLATESLVINGHTLEAGQQFGVIIGSANRDEAVFERADEFDICRKPNRHLAFGTGVYNCLGKTLARLEAQVALQVLLERMPDLALLDTRAHWRHNSFFRGLERLWLGRPQRQLAGLGATAC